MDAVLFEKTSYGVVPTREAEKLSRRAHRAFVEISQARADIDALRGRESGSTVIGAMPLARSFLVPNALIRFTQEHAEHAVSIMDGTYEHLLAALQSGQADFLIGALTRVAPQRRHRRKNICSTIRCRLSYAPSIRSRSGAS